MIEREGGGIERPFSYLLFHWAKQIEIKNFRDTDIAAADDRQRAVDRERDGAADGSGDRSRPSGRESAASRLYKK